MNGRVYDPVLGRFLSADPNIDGSYDSQGYNRYTYVGNNPLGATDPTGFFGLKDVVTIVAVVVAGVLTAGAALYGYAAIMGGSFVGGFGAALSSVTLAAGWGGGWAVAAGVGFGFGSGFAASLLNGGSLGDAFKAGIIGGIEGGVTAGAANWIGSTFANNLFARSVAHGLLEGAENEATGGQFRHGFYAGFTSTEFSPTIQRAFGQSAEAQVAAAAVIGGTASAVGGGKFANGAAEAAFSYLFNDLAEHAQSEPKPGAVRLDHARIYIEAGTAELADETDRQFSAAAGVMDIAGALNSSMALLAGDPNEIVEDILKDKLIETVRGQEGINETTKLQLEKVRDILVDYYNNLPPFRARTELVYSVYVGSEAPFTVFGIRLWGGGELWSSVTKTASYDGVFARKSDAVAWGWRQLRADYMIANHDIMGAYSVLHK